MTITDYIRQLQSYEEYAFSWNELTKNCNKTETSLKSELSRLVRKGEILNLRKGFYLIIPPRYSTLGQLPIQLYVEKLFKHLNREYYLGFYTAAQFHGASHQQVQWDYIMMSSPSVPNIQKNSLNIRFLTTSIWPNMNIVEKKADAGIFKISSPALTVLDLIRFQTKLGGLNRLFTVLEELCEEIEPQDLISLLTWYPFSSTLQRFGYLMDVFQADEDLIGLIMTHLKLLRFFPVLLSPKPGQKPGAVSNPWKVDINIDLESDL